MKLPPPNWHVEPVHIFLSGCRGTDTSYLVNVMYNAILKILPYHCKDPEKPRVPLHGPTGTTVHFGLRIKPEAQLLGLNSRSKAALRSRLSEGKLLITDEFSMLSSDLWRDID